MVLRAFLVALAAGIVLGVVPAGAASADPPVPGQYEASVRSVVPVVEGLEVRILGGDAFVEVTAPPGVLVEVPGYQGEPFLRILPDGTVEENRRSPTRWISQDRYAATPVPPEATVGAEPVWQQVGSGGRWAWHDHRAHWMGERPPLGLSPGDQVLDGVVPLVVGGEPVEVRIVAFWAPGPGLAATTLGAGTGIAAIVLIAATMRARDRRGAVTTLAVAAVVGVAAAVVGLWQFRSFPPEARTSARGWLLPVTAVAAAALAAIVAGSRRSTSTRELAVTAGALAAGVQLGQWWWWRRAVWTEPVLPTDAPDWLDRSVTAAVAVVSVALLVVGVALLFRWSTAPARHEAAGPSAGPPHTPPAGP